MLHIKALIREKREQIRLLEDHIEQLETMAAQTVGMILPRERRQKNTDQGRTRQINTHPAEPQINRVRAYLAEHPGFQRIYDMGKALDTNYGTISGQISQAVKRGEMVRGERGMVKLTDKPPAPRGKSGPKPKETTTAKAGNGTDHSRVAKIRAFLEKHPEGVKSGEIRKQLGLSGNELWGSMVTEIRAGRIVRPKPGMLALKK